MEVLFKPIGIIKTEFKEKPGVPIQSVFGQEKKGRIELFPEFKDGLKDLDGFSHIHLIYYFNEHNDYKLHVKPYLDNREHGVFATRAPKRPNAVGLSVVEVVKIIDNIIEFKGADMLDGTPLLDIKPYVDDFDIRKETRCGWYDKVHKKNTISDDRF